MPYAKKLLPPLVSGTLFGAGLTLSGMTDPARVRGFLDVFGSWDPTLAFVMGGAVLVMAIAWRIRNRMGTPIFAERFSLPDRKDLDGRLIAGSILSGSVGASPVCVPARQWPHWRSRRSVSRPSSSPCSPAWLLNMLSARCRCASKPLWISVRWSLPSCRRT